MITIKIFLKFLFLILRIFYLHSTLYTTLYNTNSVVFLTLGYSHVHNVTNIKNINSQLTNYDIINRLIKVLIKFEL